MIIPLLGLIRFNPKDKLNIRQISGQYIQTVSDPINVRQAIGQYISLEALPINIRTVSGQVLIQV